MTPDQMANLHLLCMNEYKTWSAKYYKELLMSQDHIFEISAFGFGCARIIKDEAEILILLVNPNSQRSGCGTSLLKNLHIQIQKLGCDRIFLEVARTNIAAKALYLKNHYYQIAKRTNYYSLNNGKKIDALVFEMIISS